MLSQVRRRRIIIYEDHEIKCFRPSLDSLSLQLPVSFAMADSRVASSVAPWSDEELRRNVGQVRRSPDRCCFVVRLQCVTSILCFIERFVVPF